MDRMDFTQAVSRLRVLEKRLLNKVKIERMIDSSSADEALKVLNETEYSSLMGNVKRAEDYEILLQEELERVYSLISEITPDNSLIEILKIKYDYHNIKVLLKAKALNKEFPELLTTMGTQEIDKLKDAINTGIFKGLSEEIQGVIKEVEDKFKESKDPQVIDIITDKYMYEDMLKRAEVLKEEFIIDYVKSNIDLINIRTLIRVKTQDKPLKFLQSVLLEGGMIKLDTLLNVYSDTFENIISKLSSTKYKAVVKEGLEEFLSNGKLTLFEKLFEDYLMNLVKNAKYVHFGPEPLFAYILAKETEIKIIRIIMVAKLNNVQSSVIRERLRDIYV
ncbi:V-type ATP synthase subunit C [Hathewaya histolytica]|uniref:V-type ATP synthase subunit C n=1 Tax=Hathewaya histolytica TaxID=1498 RepID=UPI003B66E625